MDPLSLVLHLFYSIFSFVPRGTLFVHLEGSLQFCQQKKSGVDAKNKLAAVYKQKYKINLDHQILTSNGIFYPHALVKDLTFELTLAPASQVVLGSDPNKLVYNLKNIQLEYRRIRSKQLADHATTIYTNGKGFAYDLVVLEKIVTFDRGTD